MEMACISFSVPWGREGLCKRKPDQVTWRVTPTGRMSERPGEQSESREKGQLLCHQLQGTLPSRSPTVIERVLAVVHPQ